MNVYPWDGLSTEAQKKTFDNEFFEKSCIDLYDEEYKNRALSKL
jgi:hypothetical protein